MPFNFLRRRRNDAPAPAEAAVTEAAVSEEAAVTASEAAPEESAAADAVPPMAFSITTLTVTEEQPAEQAVAADAATEPETDAAATPEPQQTPEPEPETEPVLADAVAADEVSATQVASPVTSPAPQAEALPAPGDDLAGYIESLRHRVLTNFEDIDRFGAEKSKRLKAKLAAIPEELRGSAWAQSWRQTLIRMVELDLLCEFATRGGPEAVAALADAPRLMRELAASGGDAAALPSQG